jgi:TolB-like protein
MSRFVRAFALASAAVLAPAIVSAQAKPVVAVMYFDNTSLGKDRADYDGVGKGMAELLINDMLANPNVRVVERERIQALVTEQNLTKAGAIDPQTAIRLGKIIGAQYMITGSFMSDGRGRFVLTAKTINVETSAIANPTRVDAKGDDVIGMIAQLSQKLNAEMKLPALRVGDAGAAPSVQPAGAPAAEPKIVADGKEQKVDPAAPPAARPAAKPATQVAQAKSTRKMDMKTAMLYSKALEEEDAGNKTKAIELYRQVNVSFPEYAPVQAKIAKLSRG